MIPLHVEEVAKVIFETQWPGSEWGTTGLEESFRRIAVKIFEKLEELEQDKIAELEQYGPHDED